jgi:hypothetical protein
LIQEDNTKDNRNKQLEKSVTQAEIKIENKPKKRGKKSKTIITNKKTDVNKLTTMTTDEKTKLFTRTRKL